MKTFNEYLEWGTDKMTDAYKKDTPGQKKEEKKLKKKKDDPCWKGYVQLGTKKDKDGQEVPNCVPEETVKENKEDMEPASPDELSMGLKQAEYIEYVAREVKEHLEKNKEFPEWMQNKLTKLHTVAESMHSALGAHGEMDEALEVKLRGENVEQIDEAKGKLVKNMRVKNIHNGNKGTVVKGGDRAGGRVEVEWDDGKTTMAAGKYLEPIKESLDEDVAANNVGSGAVDMNPTGLQRADKRRKYQTDNMFRRANGLFAIEKMIKAKREQKADK